LGGRAEADLTAEPVELFEELTDGVVTLGPWTMGRPAGARRGLQRRDAPLWLPMIPFPYTNKDGREFISHQPERNVAGAGNVGAFDAQTSELLGGCGFRGLEAERTEFDTGSPARSEAAASRRGH